MSQAERQTHNSQTAIAIRRRFCDQADSAGTSFGPKSKKQRLEKAPNLTIQETEEESDGTDTEDVVEEYSIHMKLRARMYRLAEKVEEVHRQIETGDDFRPGVEEVMKRYISAELLYKDNKMIINGRDLAVDGLCSDRMSQMLITQVAQQCNNVKKFQLKAFAETLAPMMKTYYDEHLMGVIECHEPRIVGCMFDPMAKPETKKPRPERKLVKRSAKGELLMIKGKQTNEVDDGTDVSLMEQLDRILKVFKKYLKDHNTDRVNYYEFVVDPNCFANTVQNCFYVSFLLKDGMFFLERSNVESFPVLRKLTASEKATKKDMEKGSHPSKKIQYTNTMTYVKWKFLVELYNITDAMLPPATRL